MLEARLKKLGLSLDQYWWYLERAARDARPGDAVPVQDDAKHAHDPDVARPAPPDAVEQERRAAQETHPAAAVT